MAEAKFPHRRVQNLPMSEQEQSFAASVVSAIALKRQLRLELGRSAVNEAGQDQVHVAR